MFPRKSRLIGAKKSGMFLRRFSATALTTLSLARAAPELGELGDMIRSSSRWRTIRWFALAGIVVPGVTYLMLLGSQLLGVRIVESFFFWVFAISYPFWLMLWGVMGQGDNSVLFAQLLAASLSCNGALYGAIGLFFTWARRL